MKNTYSISIIAAEFHKERIEKMCFVAQETAKTLGLDINREVWVPGCFEIPLTLSKVLKDEKTDGAIVLGVIERGETKHGLVMAEAVFGSIIELQLQHDKPIGLGIIGPEASDAQIDERVNKHARAAVEAVSRILSTVL